MLSQASDWSAGALPLAGLLQVMGRWESLSEGAGGGDGPAAARRSTAPAAGAAAVTRFSAVLRRQEAWGWLRSRGATPRPAVPQATVLLGRRSGAVPTSVGYWKAQRLAEASSGQSSVVCLAQICFCFT